ncbi:hypothetical protein B0H17DRAFT_1216393 [Mycena rosella]|uniref:Uncharacterized protein n=1 Tax=Mycena rosella TaxID=1033263 RepID=A0AAD7C9K9_MYCRO|nr:hypothetical protein B0H17DRAFT_1216393 [Mycena rosella]
MSLPDCAAFCQNNGVNKTEPRGNGTNITDIHCKKSGLQMRGAGGIISDEMQGIPWSKDCLPDALPIKTSKSLSSISMMDNHRRKNLAPPATPAMSVQPAPTKRALRSNSVTGKVANLGLNPEPKPVRKPLARKRKTPTEAADATAAQPPAAQDRKKKKPTPEPRPPTPPLDEEDPLADIPPHVDSRRHTPYDGVRLSRPPRRALSVAVPAPAPQSSSAPPRRAWSKPPPPSPTFSFQHSRSSTPIDLHKLGGAKPDDDDDDMESNFSNTEKERRRAEEQHNHEEEEALIEYEAETGGKGRHGKRKARDVEQYDSQDGDQNDDQDDADEREPDDDDDDPTCPPAWDIKPGPLSAAGVNKALAVRQAYHDMLRAVAREEGKKVSTVLKAIGDTTSLTRKTNPWNAFQVQQRALFPQPKGMSKKEHRTIVRAKYSELFADLSEDDANDPGARAACATTVMLDDQKANDRGHAMLTKVSTVTANTCDIEICGYAIDPFTDNATIWGGGQFFKGVYTRFKDAIKRSSVISRRCTSEVVAMESHDAAARGIERPIIINFGQTATEKSHRDTRRRVLHKMFLNDIHVVLAQRGDNLTLPKDMSWKWLEMAIRLHLRIVEWPVELKLAFPNAGFAITHIKEASVLKAMVAAMKARYLGTDDAVEEDTPRIVSWTEEECDMPLTDILNVPLVVCADGSVLLYARDSKDLLRCLAPKGKGKAKASAHQESDDDESDDDESNDDGAPNASKKRKSRAPGGRAAKRPRTAGPSTAQNTVAPAASGSNAAGAPSGASGNSASGPGEMMCCYFNRQDFSESFVGAVMKYRDEPTRIQCQTQVWTAGGWRALPKGLGVAVSEADEARCELLRFYIGLADD